MNKKKVRSSSRVISNSNNSSKTKVSTKSSKVKTNRFKKYDKVPNMTEVKDNVLESSGAEIIEFKKELPKLDEEIGINNSKENQNSNTSQNTKIISDPKIPVREDSPAWLKLIALIIFSGILIFWVGIILISTSISTGQKTMETNITAITYSPIKTDFSNYALISNKGYNENISLIGYLRKENSDEKLKKYILDDQGNKITVKSDIKYDELFTTHSRYTYNVSGNFNSTPEGYVLNAEEIIKHSRIIIESRELRTENVTVGRKAGIYIDLSVGWRKIFKIFS